ncbi:MAG TPA: zinc ABC transporter substrate-binding protein [Flavobacteriaceae bacterium]|nr:zinc ABC transporter substrate-binding protein [Flavobacteriaceae bacterium]
MKMLPFLILSFLFLACNKPKPKDDRLKVLATTNIVADLISRIGGNEIALRHLMGPGVDPHLYKASEGDVLKLYEADIIFYGGLHLEGKLTDVFAKLKDKRHMVALGDSLPKNQLLESSNFGGSYDPHVWFDVDLVKEMCSVITKELIAIRPEQAAFFRENNMAFQKELSALKAELIEKVNEIPEEKRILVTAHDAFGYFGKSFGFKVVGLQGISTATEAGVKDVRALADFIVTHEIKSIFVENSVPRRMIEALQAAVKARGFEVSIGGELFSDTLGNKNSSEGTYIGMYTYNVNTIVNGLKE